jgi:hypothetical protein
MKTTILRNYSDPKLAIAISAPTVYCTLIEAVRQQLNGEVLGGDNSTRTCRWPKF